MMTKRLFVKNIDRDVTAEQIISLFSTYGDVDDFVLKRRRGIGFIQMTSASEALRARKNLDGESIWGRSLDVTALHDSLGGRLFYLLQRYF